MAERDTTGSSSKGPGVERGGVVELAWSPFSHFTRGEIANGLAILDDEGTWWINASRSAIPMSAMKAVMAEVFSSIPMTFELVGSIVEGNRAVLMAESHAMAAEIPYNGVYAFVVDVDPDQGVVVGVREYADTHHGAEVLTPILAQAAEKRNVGGDFAELIESIDSSAG